MSIFRFGPLVRHWTMRFEAKHSYFKRLAQSMGNFINIPYSLAMRHQQLQCYWSTNDRDIPGSGLTVGPGMYVCVCVYVSIDTTPLVVRVHVGCVVIPDKLQEKLDFAINSVYE